MEGIQVEVPKDKLEEMLGEKISRQQLRGYLVREAQNFVSQSGLSRKQRRSLAREVGKRTAGRAQEDAHADV
jgi:hypothetical protein